MPEFHVVSEYSPAGDQPQAIEKLAAGYTGYSLCQLCRFAARGKIGDQSFIHIEFLLHRVPEFIR